MEPFAQQSLSGWGRTPRQECRVYRPEKRRALHEIIENGRADTLIPRGLGRSYGDTSINPGAGVIDMTRLNRLIAFDPDTATLHTEAGVSFAEILDIFVPRGYILPVTPGTKFITVGGAIANDVHGKNHHRDGTFGEFVDEFDLLTPTGDTLTCSRNENADVFWATLGGIGLTGAILTAKFRLLPIESAWFVVDYYQAKNIEDVLKKMYDTQHEYRYSVSWVDCIAKGAKLGRSVLMNGRHATRADVAGLKYAPLEIPKKREKSIPIDFPGFALNPYSIRAFNELFYHRHPTVNGKLTDYDTYFYPLDAIHSWNRMYGKQGFTQYQIALPFDAKHALIDILQRVSESGRASFLAVLKCFGKQNDGMLSFPFEGYTLTLDFAMRPDLPAFLHDLDKILVKNGGRLYLAKDVCMTAQTFRAMYPRLDEFQQVRNRLDPEGKLSSAMSRRLGIT